MLTHSVPREWAGRQSPFTFVTNGIDSALALARAIAGDKDVGIGGSASVIQQYLAARLIDELRLHLSGQWSPSVTAVRADLRWQ